MTEPLLRGDIDAVVNPPPQATEQERRLGTDSITFENQQLYRGTWNLVGRPEFVKAHPDAVKKLLRALIQAEHYMVQNPDDARKITTDYIGKDAPDLSDYNYDVRIDRALLVSLEEQARWAISAGLSDKREIPNYLTFFYPDDLEAVAPESVALR
jgi:NitT/TauT family transport system substrate-binding protein